jgi:uncharacterized SAM-binding protein YcdF (DUF218 family)
MSRGWERALRNLGISTTVLFLILALTPLSNSLGKSFAPVSQIQPADAIVVLAAGVMHGGSLEDESLRRAMAGIALHKQGLAPILVLSGKGRPKETQTTEAEQRSRLAQAMGVAPETILKEETANTTREEAVRISRLLMHRGLRRILLVTESLHLRRAKLVFESAGLEVFPAASDDYSIAVTTPSARLWLAVRVVQESAALAYYRVAGYI